MVTVVLMSRSSIAQTHARRSGPSMSGRGARGVSQAMGKRTFGAGGAPRFADLL
jgi:hypothetical protein